MTSTRTCDLVEESGTGAKWFFLRKPEITRPTHRSNRRNCTYGPDVRMVETRDRSNFFDDSLREKDKKEGKEEKLKDAWRKAGPFGP